MNTGDLPEVCGLRLRTGPVVYEPRASRVEADLLETATQMLSSELVRDTESSFCHMQDFWEERFLSSHPLPTSQRLLTGLQSLIDSLGHLSAGSASLTEQLVSSALTCHHKTTCRCADKRGEVRMFTCRDSPVTAVEHYSCLANSVLESVASRYRSSGSLRWRTDLLDFLCLNRELEFHFFELLLGHDPPRVLDASNSFVGGGGTGLLTHFLCSVFPRRLTVAVPSRYFCSPTANGAGQEHDSRVNTETLHQKVESFAARCFLDVLGTPADERERAPPAFSEKLGRLPSFEVWHPSSKKERHYDPRFCLMWLSEIDPRLATGPFHVRWAHSTQTLSQAGAERVQLKSLLSAALQCLTHLQPGGTAVFLVFRGACLQTRALLFVLSLFFSKSVLSKPTSSSATNCFFYFVGLDFALPRGEGAAHAQWLRVLWRWQDKGRIFPSGCVEVLARRTAWPVFAYKCQKFVLAQVMCQYLMLLKIALALAGKHAPRLPTKPAAGHQSFTATSLPVFTRALLSRRLQRGCCVARRRDESDSAPCELLFTQQQLSGYSAGAEFSLRLRRAQLWEKIACEVLLLCSLEGRQVTELNPDARDQPLFRRRVGDSARTGPFIADVCCHSLEVVLQCACVQKYNALCTACLGKWESVQAEYELVLGARDTLLYFKPRQILQILQKCSRDFGTEPEAAPPPLLTTCAEKDEESLVRELERAVSAALSKLRIEKMVFARSRRFSPEPTRSADAKLLWFLPFCDRERSAAQHPPPLRQSIFLTRNGSSQARRRHYVLFGRNDLLRLWQEDGVHKI